MTWVDDRTRLILILTSSSRDDSDAAVRYRSRRNHCQLHTRTTVIGISINAGAVSAIAPAFSPHSREISSA